MTLATTSSYDKLVLEVSSDGGTTWARLCGIMDATVTRTSNIETSEVPDCDDESKPNQVEREVRSTEMSVSGSGVWAQESHQTILDWWRGGTLMDARIGYLNAAAGDTEYETGKAVLGSVENQRTKGQKVTASIDVQFSGATTETAKPV